MKRAFDNCGNTALVCLIAENKIYIANAGDSRVIRVHKDN